MFKISILLLLFFTSTCSVLSAQGITKDTVPGKDTAKVGKLVQAIIKDTTKRKETKKDTVVEKKSEKKFYGIPQFAHETYLFVAAPTRWDKTDWLRVGLVAAGIAAIMPFDQRITNSTQGNQHYYYSVAVVGGRTYGEWYTIGSLTVLIGTYGILAHNDPVKKIAIELLQAGVYSGLITELLKIGIGRYRPYEDAGPFKFHPFNVNNNTESMPSGHSTCAFALSTVMSRHAHSTFLKILVYVPACFTLFARIYQDEHWGSDVFFGSAIGLATGSWVVTLHEGKSHKMHIRADNK